MHPYPIRFTHVLAVIAVVALAFAALGDRGHREAVFGGLLLLAALVSFLLLSLALRPEPLRAVLDDPPADDDELMAALESGLRSPPVFDPDATAKGRFRLMQLYKVRK